MNDPFILILFALGLLAVLDLVVGVSNDAVNFLNSAIGSKAIPIKSIMIIASVGVFFGAVTSSGMMEVARKGIFNPEMYMFQDIMFIFTAVMITDILLLDVFNSLALPTSTTVSIVFELLGAAVTIALIKILTNDSASIDEIWNYINHEKAKLIVLGIVLSVLIAFSVGAIVQYFSRILYSFDFGKRPSYISAFFGGFALTSITYFIIIKGLKGTPFYGNIENLIANYTNQIVILSFLVWTVVSWVYISVLKWDILKFIIGVGTFSLAVAFAGNDLVNFIGVPIAALNSYDIWLASGVNPESFAMGSLASKVPSNTWLLLLAGLVMVITLWTSKKARSVIDTGINLSRQGEGQEKFKPNNVSRVLVRFAMYTNNGFTYLMPKKALKFIDAKFQKPKSNGLKSNPSDEPAFDKVRASVNLIMASILISIATSMKLPLSTTYVTFMVAMGTSLADRAWGRESAVYRVAGVISVVAGWFLTAVIAFVVSGTIAFLIQWNTWMVLVLMIVVGILITRTTLAYRKKAKEEKEISYQERAELISINGIIEESSGHIAKVAERVNKLYTNVVNDLAKQDLNKLRKNDKLVLKLNHEIDDLKDGVFYFIKSLEEESVEASKFYIQTLGYLQDIAQSISFVSRASYKHVNNNHKNLKKGQIRDLISVDKELADLLSEVKLVFSNRSFDELELLIKEKRELLTDVSNSIEKQVARIRSEETSPKNTTLYFSILLETQDLVTALMSLLELYQEFYLSTKQLDR